MGMNLRLSSSASGTRNVIVNMGGGANLVQRSLYSTNTPSLPYSSWYTPGVGSPSLSTSDHLGQSAFWNVKPFDLNTAGADGAAISAANGGNRYVWVLGPDHPSSLNFNGSVGFFVGFSNDPQIFPESTILIRHHGIVTTPTDEFGVARVNFFIYNFPQLIYNPDASIGANPFGADAISGKWWIYAEAQGNGSQHEHALFTTADFRTTATIGPVIANTNLFAGWTSLGNTRRISTGVWETISFGRRSGEDDLYYKYTSTDGITWVEDYSTPKAGNGDRTIISSQNYMLTTETGITNDYISLLAINSAVDVPSPAVYTRISTAYGPSVGNNTAYPSQTWVQSPRMYEEDGVASIYVTRGFFSGINNSLNDGPYLGNSPTFYDIVCGISSNLMTVTSVPGGMPPLAVGFRLSPTSPTTFITSLGTGTGGTGTYGVTVGAPTISPGTTLTVCTNGGLWNQFVDLYSYTTDASSAANAAPLGVMADCTSNTVTVSWNNVLPNNTYRVYRGTTSGTQATLVGNVTGNSITDTPTTGAQYWYKVVTMNSGVEQKSRVVDVYVSNNSQMVNRHVRRVINDGGDSTKINMTFLASVDSYLTSNDYYKYLIHWVDARFGVKIDGSGFVSKIYCLGTTRVPKWGDYTPTTSDTWPSTSSNTSYSATSFRGTTPSWINNASSAHGYFWNGRAGLIQRKNQITVIAAYQRPSGTGDAYLFGYGQGYGMYLWQPSGSSGNVSFSLSSSLFTGPAGIVATVPFASATAAHVAAGVHDGATMTAYLDGVAGTPIDSSAFNNPLMLNDSVLRGDYRTLGNQIAVLSSGTGSNSVQNNAITKTYNLSNGALFTGAGLIVFDKGLPSAVTGVTALYA